jgi:uncharacterized protein (DUF488 family)
MSTTVWTLGHSTRTWQDFLLVLAAHDIRAVADVRRFPGSRRHPWFASEAMAQQLPLAGIGYTWLPSLGGRRRAQPQSPNGAWRNAAFQGYADHMRSAEFRDGLAVVLALAATQRTAILCAELLWWRCHRRLIADLLQHRGYEVLHILDQKSAQLHPGNPAAQGEGEDLIYPPPQGELFAG